MGKIHDRIKDKAQRLATVAIAPIAAGKPRDTAREISVLLQDLQLVRHEDLGAVTRHRRMQEYADQARRLGLKGRWNLLCNRTQCLRPDAKWYNRGSYAFYCDACAADLNQVNRRDAEDFLGAGQKLCVLVETAEAAAGLRVLP